MVEALYDCEADHPDELGFKEGEHIIVTKMMNKDWWVSGEMSDSSGGTPLLVGGFIFSVVT